MRVNVAKLVGDVPRKHVQPKCIQFQIIYKWVRTWVHTRTTNAVESFHSHFKNNFYMSHPNIHNFLNVLLQLQSEVYIKIKSIGTIKTRKGTLVRQHFILNEIKKYEEGEKTRFE